VKYLRTTKQLFGCLGDMLSLHVLQQLWSALYQSWQRYLPAHSAVWKEIRDIKEHDTQLRNHVVRLRKYVSISLLLHGVTAMSYVCGSRWRHFVRASALWRCKLRVLYSG